MNSKKEKAALLMQKLKTYFKDERDLEVGQFDCELLLGLITTEICGFYYNQGLNDAQALIAHKFDDIGDALYELEQRL